jgi:hypothetical protein
MKATPAMLVVIAITALASCTLASIAAVRRVLSLDAAIVFKA